MSTTTNVSSELNQSGKNVQLGYDPKIAYVLGLCCQAADDQYKKYVTNDTNGQIQSVSNPPWNADFSKITDQGYKNPKSFNLSVYEQNDKQPAQLVQIPAGFGVELEPTDPNKSKISVVAFHGTQNAFEWNQRDLYPNPALFATSLGYVHGGDYAQYTSGSDGTQKTLPTRASGSLAESVSAFMKLQNGTHHVYVTGHSLGGALAALCAMDIACNFSGQFTSISMYSLASTRVAAGWVDDTDDGTDKDVNTFIKAYQAKVPDSYRIVNTADPVPGNPWTIVGKYTFAHALGDKFISLPNDPLNKNVQSFTNNNPDSNGGPHSLDNVYVPFLSKLNPLGQG